MKVRKKAERRVMTRQRISALKSWKEFVKKVRSEKSSLTAVKDDKENKEMHERKEVGEKEVEEE